MVQFIWGIGSWLPWPWVCTHNRTQETDAVIGANTLILGSFFLLFLNFYIHTYKKKAQAGKTVGSAAEGRRKSRKIE